MIGFLRIDWIVRSILFEPLGKRNSAVHEYNVLEDDVVFFFLINSDYRSFVTNDEDLLAGISLLDNETRLADWIKASVHTFG